MKQNIIIMGGTVNDDSMDGLATAVLTIPQTINTNNMTGTIKYQYHYHDTSSSCYKAAVYCSGSAPGTVEDPEWKGHYMGSCNVCGKWQYEGSCSQLISGAYYTCGYTNGQIVGATITY